MSKYLKSLIGKINNPDAKIVEEGLEGSDVTGFIDTGSYVLNALLSGTIYGHQVRMDLYLTSKFSWEQVWYLVRAEAITRLFAQSGPSKFVP